MNENIDPELNRCALTGVTLGTTIITYTLCTGCTVAIALHNNRPP